MCNDGNFLQILCALSYSTPIPGSSCWPHNSWGCSSPHAHLMTWSPSRERTGQRLKGVALKEGRREERPGSLMVLVLQQGKGTIFFRTR